LKDLINMKKLLKRFICGERGNVTVEFVLWLPLIAGIIVATFDLNIVLMTQSNMYNVARDTARRVSTGQLNASTGQDYAQQYLNYMGFEYGVEITTGENVTVEITTSLGRVAALGVMGAMKGYNLNASVTMRTEPE